MIIISPWAKQMPDNKPNPKNYPWWSDLIQVLPPEIIQVGVSGEIQLVPDFRCNLSMSELGKLILSCDFWISCDSFIQHFAWDLGKPGAVLWGPSDPNIFGHPENLNISKGPEFKSDQQFLMWHLIDCRDDWWQPPHVVSDLIQKRFLNQPK